MDDRFERWKDAISGGDSDRGIGRRLGMDNTKVARHLYSVPPVAETVILLARAYGADPLEGLVEAGLLTADEASAIRVPRALRLATSLQLAAEIYRRELESAGEADDPFDDASGTSQTAPTMSPTTARGATQVASEAPAASKQNTKRQRRERLTRGLRE
ncbi:hypothetical protein D5S18_03070 [Nocardia panacis]|uniref:Uncharacterized protein n=1 Tax=Nocardia panacis TaxID=2340916 RepID=A0A3A4KBT9_9NOCA|nr:hypothetical protein [Nocardia panacis]RJO79327.1 hypothetical protein D5S18_03070 [Nocardia panacis]